jgi:hypothetical protein
MPYLFDLLVMVGSYRYFYFFQKLYLLLNRVLNSGDKLIGFRAQVTCYWRQR